MEGLPLFMKKIFVILYLFGNTLVAQQNLVLDPGLEDYIYCPMGPGGLDQHNLTYWDKSSISATSDYFNSCVTVSCPGCGCEVPSNFVGYQPAHSGNGYGGIVFLNDCSPTADCSSYREDVQVQLNNPMKKGQAYSIALYPRMW